MKYLYGALALLVLQAIAGVLLLYSGAISVAASEPHSALVSWILSTASENSITRHARDVRMPDDADADAARAEAGFAAFRDMCVTCHGAPGREPSAIGKGLRPRAPDLAHAAEDMSAKELFWTVKHGIKMTGMPAWGATHSDDDLWAVVRFLEHLPSLSPEDYRALERRAGTTAHEDHGP